MWAQVEEERAFHDQAHRFICDFVRLSGNKVAVGEGEFVQVMVVNRFVQLSIVYFIYPDEYQCAHLGRLYFQVQAARNTFVSPLD